MTYRHVVLFRFHDDVAEERVLEAERVLADLADLPGVVSWVVRRSDDARKGRVVVENGLFEDAATFAAWREHPRHRAAGEVLRELADWWIGDYEEPRG